MRKFKKLSIALLAFSSLACTLTFAQEVQYNGPYENGMYGSTFSCPPPRIVNSYLRLDGRSMTSTGLEWHWTKRADPLIFRNIDFHLAQDISVTAPTTGGLYEEQPDHPFLSLKATRLDSVNFQDRLLTCSYTGMVTANGAFFKSVPIVLQSSAERGDFTNCTITGDNKVLCPRS